jgi:uncharacterized protein (DUF983 family)
MRRFVRILFQAGMRGIRGRCPSCGDSRLFCGWNRLQETCPTCGLALGRIQENTWAFMYMSTAALTGMVVIGMFLLTPADVRVGRVVVFLIAFFLITGTLPIRKGIAIAFEVAIEKRWGSEDDALADVDSGKRSEQRQE